jgi:hypothetical protein
LRAPLLISGFSVTQWDDYRTCTAMQEQAFELGIHEL